MCRGIFDVTEWELSSFSQVLTSLLRPITQSVITRQMLSQEINKQAAEEIPL